MWPPVGLSIFNSFWAVAIEISRKGKKLEQNESWLQWSLSGGDHNFEKGIMMTVVHAETCTKSMMFRWLIRPLGSCIIFITECPLASLTPGYYSYWWQRCEVTKIESWLQKLKYEKQKLITEIEIWKTKVDYRNCNMKRRRNANDTN